MRNHSLVVGAVQVNKIKILKHKLLCGVRDVKTLKNIVFDME